ncbi:hypothetical protein K0504_03650 [Neiella marina]|uniref:Uncharacterized protein n=1 Tax=Neiella holothuriorum TaxID=2870530 RepID=A0ABS7ECS7_9GAMM|nr:hypothetical protein [Neiella holothuriorum]MBW8190120.1 hypothetical protein [Neiella holothuriorum]
MNRASKHNFGTLSAVTVTSAELIIVNNQNERIVMNGEDWQQLRPMMQAKALNLLNEEVVITTHSNTRSVGSFYDLEPAA